MKYKINSFLIIAFTIALFFVVVAPTSGKFPFSLGLDLVGGTELVYKADVSKLDSGDIDSSLSVLRDVIERRVNIFGVSEPLVQRETARLNDSVEERLLVELPGVTDLESAVSQIGKTPTLEFLIEKEGAQDILNQEEPLTEENIRSIFEPTGLDGGKLSRAQLNFDQTTGVPSVGITFNDQGKELFRSITEKNNGKILGIFLDGSPVSLPIIQSVIYDGSAEITGDFTIAEARAVVENLNYGALPVPVELIGSQKVGPTLGQDALNKGVKAGFVGLISVSIFLILWYRVPGIISVLALIAYVIFSLALFKLIPVTLTAAGIAGFVLSIGMAVDANILIFERMKEELAKGRSLKESADDGFKRAWLSIRDSNISSIITAIVLFWLGTSAVKGFALTLGVGVLVSMITAISVSRTFLFAVIPNSNKPFIRKLFSAGLNFKN